MEYRCQMARWIKNGTLIGVLTASAACSDQPENTEGASPVTATTEVELRTVPATFAEYEEDVRVRFVAYGDVDPNDNVPFGVISNVQIAVIDHRKLPDWWNTVGAGILGHLDYIPPGAQIKSTVEDVANSSADFVYTELDGEAEIYLEPPKVFSICVVSQTGDLIAGCSLSQSTGKWRAMDFYIYFSHGRAYIDREEDGNERYYRSLYGDKDSYSPLNEPATITFISTAHTGTDVPPFVDFLAPGASLAVISDSEIGTWWTAVSDSVTAVTDSERYPLLVSSGWEFGWGIPYGMEVRERVLQSLPVRIIDIGWPGIIEMNMAPGNYLLCHVTYEFIADCNYDNIAAGQNYIYRVTVANILRLSDIEGRQLLEEVKDWRIRAKRAN